MRWTHKHTCIGMLAIAAIILAIAAMNPVSPRPTDTGEIGPSNTIKSSSDTAPTPSTARPVITLGNLDPSYIPRTP
jgi:hypothetical protein